MSAAHPGYHCLHVYASHTFHRFLKSAARSPKETIMCRNEHSEDSNPPHIKHETTGTTRNRLRTLAIPFDLADEIRTEDSDMSDHGEELELGKAMAKICEVNHRGLYLLLMSFYHQIDHKRRLLKLSKDCSASDVQELQPFLRGIPESKKLTSEALILYLQQNHPEPVFRLVKWMQMTFGQNYFPPPDFLEVSGFADDIWQFASSIHQHEFEIGLTQLSFETTDRRRYDGTALQSTHFTPSFKMVSRPTKSGLLENQAYRGDIPSNRGLATH
ncbi:hypothetical protein BPAE_0073g00270 [Botrytis paeoniae]|uniref:Uncharacterized protein n=1 Tax=Botrytis paeoniae TaxID=278948 RepID=A0A4Z1FVL3_9HELO|nr:hypothetical protein BPAE_0073g00270 [Botrytis paeoniae]